MTLPRIVTRSSTYHQPPPDSGVLHCYIFGNNGGNHNHLENSKLDLEINFCKTFLFILFPD